MSLVVQRPHNKYGSAILIRNDLNVKKIFERVQGTVEIITIVMPGVVVHSVYKPPNVGDNFESCGTPVWIIRAIDLTPLHLVTDLSASDVVRLVALGIVDLAIFDSSILWLAIECCHRSTATQIVRCGCFP